MHYENCYPGINRYGVWLAKQKARQICRHYGFTPADRQDIEQELVLHLVLNLPRHAPQRGELHTFINCVIESKVATLVTSNTAPVRDRRRCTCSLDEPIENEVGELRELIDEEHNSSRAPWDREVADSRASTLASRLDVNEVIERLSPQQQSICKALKDGTPTEVIRELKIPRIRFYKERKLLRRIFAEAGLGEFV